MRIRKPDSRPAVSLEPIKPPIVSDQEPALPQKSDAFRQGVIANVDVTTIVPTKVPHAWAKPLEGTAKQTGAELKTAGQLLHEAGDAVGVTDSVGLEAHAIGADCNNLGSQVEALASAVQVPAGTVHADIGQLDERVQALVEKATRRNVAQRALDKLSDGASAVGRALKTYTQGVGKAVDYAQNIDALGEQDTYRLGVEAFLMALGGMVEGRGSIEVARKAGRYSVSMDGELAAGAFVDFGFKVFGAGIQAFASAVAGKGVKYELSFATADEAKKAVGLMLSRLGKKASGRELTADEAELFKKNLAAVELKGHAAVSGWAMLGLPSVWALVAEAKARATHTVRLEVGDRPALVLTEELSARHNTGMNVGTKGEVLALMQLAGAKGEAKVLLERRIELDQPPGLADPMATLKRLKNDVDRSRAAHRVLVSYEGQGGVLGSGGGIGLELGLSSDLEALKASGAIERALEGDLEGAIDRLPPSTDVEGRFDTFAGYGVEIGPAVYFMSFGAGIALEAMRKDVDFEHRKQAKAPAKDAYAGVKRWLSSVAKAP